MRCAPEVRDFVARVTDTEPTIFDEQAALGSETVIEKLERLGSGTGFAIALMTADDVGSATGDDALLGRARQNVLIELGWFLGRLGRERVRIIRDVNAEMPSDFGGILYTSTAGNWKTELAGDLKAAGLPVDLNAALR